MDDFKELIEIILLGLAVIFIMVLPIVIFKCLKNKKTMLLDDDLMGSYGPIYSK